LIRQIAQDFATLEDSKIVQDNDKFLVVKAVIASEIVHKYKDGMAYKPADELEKATWTANGRWVKALSHPTSDHIRNVNDINGRMENPRFRKDLNDPKTRAAYYTVEAGLNDSVKFASAEDYCAAAERRISLAEAAQGLPIVIGTDDTFQ
jgi:hypothetical protein